MKKDEYIAQIVEAQGVEAIQAPPLGNDVEQPNVERDDDQRRRLGEEPVEDQLDEVAMMTTLPRGGHRARPSFSHARQDD